MSLSSSDWFNNSSKPSKQQVSPCESKRGDCLKIIQSILDGEATSEQQKHFEEHILECMPCFEQYNLDRSIKQALQTKICKMEVPVGLIDDIKLKINNIA